MTLVDEGVSIVPLEWRPTVLWVANKPEAVAGSTADDELNYRLWDATSLLSTAMEQGHPDRTFTTFGALRDHEIRANPTAKWVCESMGNYTWVYDVARAFADEFERRVGLPHTAWEQYVRTLPRRPSQFPSDVEDRTMRPQHVPTEFQRLDTIAAYRDWVAVLHDNHGRRPTYTDIAPPRWLKERDVSTVHVVDVDPEADRDVDREVEA